MTPASPDGPTARDRSLISAVIRGDPEATDVWYRREHPEVFRLALGFLAAFEEAEDLAQDAMLHLMDRLEAWNPERPFRSWRNAVVANLCRDRLRRGQARQRAEDRLADAPLPERLPQPETVADQGEIRELVVRTLARLPEREREVFVLRDLEEFPSTEVAETLGIQESTVRSLLTLARRRLRRLLGPRLRAGLE